MGAPKIRRSLLKKQRQNLRLIREHMKNPAPVVTVAMSDGRVLAVGINRETLAQELSRQGIVSYELFDYAVTV